MPRCVVRRGDEQTLTPHLYGISTIIFILYFLQDEIQPLRRKGRDLR